MASGLCQDCTCAVAALTGICIWRADVLAGMAAKPNLKEHQEDGWGGSRESPPCPTNSAAVTHQFSGRGLFRTFQEHPLGPRRFALASKAFVGAHEECASRRAGAGTVEAATAMGGRWCGPVLGCLFDSHMHDAHFGQVAASPFSGSAP